MIISILMIVVGLSIRISAICLLKNNIHWRILAPKRLIKEGIYKYIRHPMYTGGLLDYTGFVWLITGHFSIAFAFFLLLINFTIDRIDREEQFLFSIFGQEYLDYIKKTKMLIPFIA